jgi:hypothetical protein
MKLRCICRGHQGGIGCIAVCLDLSAKTGRNTRRLRKLISDVWEIVNGSSTITRSGSRFPAWRSRGRWLVKCIALEKSASFQVGSAAYVQLPESPRPGVWRPIVPATRNRAQDRMARRVESQPTRACGSRPRRHRSRSGEKADDPDRLARPLDARRKREGALRRWPDRAADRLLPSFDRRHTKSGGDSSRQLLSIHQGSLRPHSTSSRQ